MPTTGLPASTSAVTVLSTATVPAGSVLTYDEGKWTLWGDEVAVTGIRAVTFSFRPEAAAAAAA